MMFKLKLYEELLVKRLQGVTKKVRTAANELREQHAERKINDRELGKIRNEIASTEAALAELTGLVKQIKEEAEVIVHRRLEQSETEETTMRRIEAGVDEFADVGTLTANTIDYLASSPPALARLIGGAGLETLALAIQIVADEEKWETLRALQETVQERLNGQ